QLDIASPEKLDPEHGVGDELLEKRFLLEAMHQVEGVVVTFFPVDGDGRGVIEETKEHLPVIVRFFAFHEVFPDHPLFIQPVPDDKHPVAVDEFLVYKGIDEEEVGEMLPDMK